MYERMLDKSNKPALKDMQDFCGEVAAIFDEINTWVAATFQTDMRIKFPYGNKYGWCQAHYVKTKLICNVFAEAGAVCVMFRLTDKQFAVVRDQVGEITRSEIDHRYPCGDGGWLHYRVTEAYQLQDLKCMLSQKINKR